MLRVLQIATLIGLFTFVVSLVTLNTDRLLDNPQQQSHSQTPQQGPEKGTSGQKAAESWWDGVWRDPINLFTAVLAIATIALVIVSICQSWIFLRADRTANRAATAAEDSAKTGKSALIAVQRAFVFIDIRL